MEYVREAIKALGGPSRAAELCSVSVQAACFWRDGKRPFPKEHAPAFERALCGRFACEQLSPSASWQRVPDAAWPWHPDGKPLCDFVPVDATTLRVDGTAELFEEVGASD